MSNAASSSFEHALLQARSQGTPVLQELAENHLPLVAAMVKRFPWHCREPEELYQQGCVGLMKALARFEPSYGVHFSTYAAAIILGEMRMLCRLDVPVHIPRGEKELRSRIRHTEAKLAVHLGRDPTIHEIANALRMEPSELTLAMESICVTSGDTPSGHALIELMPDPDDWMNRLLMRDIISRLSPDDQRLLILRLHLGKTQLETAKILGTSQVQVSRREYVLKQQIRKEWLEA